MDQQPVNAWNQPVPPPEPGAIGWGKNHPMVRARIRVSWAPGVGPTEVHHRGHHIGNIVEDDSSTGTNQHHHENLAR